MDVAQLKTLIHVAELGRKRFVDKEKFHTGCYIGTARPPPRLRKRAAHFNLLREQGVSAAHTAFLNSSQRIEFVARFHCRP